MPQVNLTTDEEWDLETLWFVKPREFDARIRLKDDRSREEVVL